MNDSVYDLARMDSSSLCDRLIDAASERALLVNDDAPFEELSSAQGKIDNILQELSRRLSW